MLRRSLCCFREVRRNYTTFNHGRSSYGKPPTLSSTVSFGSGSWYTTEKDPARAIPFKTFRCDVEAVVVLLFVRSGETTLFKSDAFKYQASVQVAGVLLKGSCKSHTIQDPVVMLRRSLCVEAVVVFEVRRNYTTLQPWPFELQVQATDAFKHCKLRFR
jgi:hypothetical protein